MHARAYASAHTHTHTHTHTHKHTHTHARTHQALSIRGRQSAAALQNLCQLAIGDVFNVEFQKARAECARQGFAASRSEVHPNCGCTRDGCCMQDDEQATLKGCMQTSLFVEGDQRGLNQD
eukprot:1161675-Pelagomonas_calceolata.AAC.7